MSSEKKLPPSDLLNALFRSPTDARIMRLYKVLSSASGMDSTLTLAGYALTLISTQLSSLQAVESLLLRLLPASAQASPAVLEKGTSSLLNLVSLEQSARILAGMCSDFRRFTRLWGLLGVYALSKRNYLRPSPDPLLNAVHWTQMAILGAYYIYENSYYLAMKGVLKGWTPLEIKATAKRSLRMFLAYTLLEFARLYRARELLRRRRATTHGAKDLAEIEEERKTMWRTAVLDLAYTPLAFHWSAENGLLSESVVAALMTFVGFVKFKASWALAA